MQIFEEDYYVDIHRVLVAKKHTLTPTEGCDYSQGRRMYGLIFGIRGSAVFFMKSGKRHELCAGQIAFVPAATAYRIEAKQEFLHYTVNLSLHLEEEANRFAWLYHSDPVILTPQNPELYENLFASVCTIWRERELGFCMEAVSLCYRLLREFISEQWMVGVDTVSYEKIRPAKEYLDRHFNTTTSLTELAELCGMSETSFRRLFGQVLGMTPGKYRDKLRLWHAKDYLLGNICSMDEIALRCGFRDANYFSRFFKKHTGICPTGYRAMNI
jgi:AraC-like DNA-binding protein